MPWGGSVASAFCAAERRRFMCHHSRCVLQCPSPKRISPVCRWPWAGTAVGSGPAQEQSRRRNSSRFSSSSIVRNMWNVVYSCWGDPNPWACSHGATAHTLAALLHHITSTSQRNDKHKGGVECLQALYIVATTYHNTNSHQHTHTQPRQMHCRCTRVSLLALVGRLQTSVGI